MMAPAPPPPQAKPAARAPSDALLGEAAKAAAPEPEALEPSDAWLDFDSLRLGANHDRARRGRLTRDAGTPLAVRRDAARRQIEDAAGPAGVRDPQLTRGLFDHVYRASGTADVASDAIPHRVAVSVGKTTPKLRWRTVPREAADVYKEAVVANPFGAPLLAGPVEVYVEGSLLTTTSVERVDTGGTTAVGLGVEDRIKVARNTRVAEDTSGLLVSETEVKHTVTIELTSSLAAPARVEVLDRVPVTDDKNLSVDVIATRPASTVYKQDERGAPIRGGLAWNVDLAAGGKAKVELDYKLSFAAKNEVVGGNRRE
jgi:uncharacterized protein (TIGR02231 family)